MAEVVQALFPISTKQEIDNIQLKLKTTISGNSRIASCLILPNKQVMFSDYEQRRLLIYNEDGSFCRDLKIPFKVFDTTIIGGKNVAVSLSEKNIQKIDIESGKHQTIVPNCASHWSWGISHSQNKIYYIAYGEGIKVSDMEGEIIAIFPVDQDGNLGVYKITTFRNNMYYSDALNMVHCIDEIGDVLWEAEDERFQHLADSASLAVDKHGNVFVTGYSKNLLLVISGDGQYTRVLLDSSDGLNKPSSVYFDRDSDTLLICNEGDGHAALYDVLY